MHLCIGPKSEPVNLTITFINSSALLLSWSKPIQPNGIIIKYTFNCSNNLIETETINENTTLVGLKPYTNYTCSVRAHTAVGSGPVATMIGQTDESSINQINPCFITNNNIIF